ncbi:MAG: energy-coupling factor transporter ATPase [Oscillospiraceae bacterium]|jgi:energy-coupling factor transport system ATP-binding protein|nr:energy-coupling factor transporter ATPase [Oscillospiraceae bacterium]
MRKETVITLKDVSFHYGDSANVLKNLNIEIKRGEFTAVVGRNGSGKSTFAKLLGAILLPTSGTVEVDGFDTLNEDNHSVIRRKAGMVFQNPDNQIVSSVVEEDVAFALENMGVEPKEMRKRVDDALNTVGLYEHRFHAPHQLSGGQKQRVAIAGIIAMRPECIILDEATAMLDPVGRQEVLQTLYKLIEQYGVTVLHITHYMNEAADADRVIVFDEGCVLLDGTPDEVFSQEESIKSAGLELPRDVRFVLKSNLNRQTVTELAYAKEAGNPEWAVKTENLTYTYGAKTPFEKTAIKDINIGIKAGETVGVIGHSGSGKSTLIQHFNGLLKPAAGKVYIDGEDIWADKKKIRSIRFKAGLVFQYPEHQIFEETVYKAIAFGPKNMGLSEDEIDKRVRETAAMVGLSEQILKKSPFEISGGQRRRTAIAGVLAMHPEILVLDEPAAGLDPEGKNKIFSLIQTYQQKKDATVVIVSHSMEDIAKYATKVLVMNESEAVCYDTVQNVLTFNEN